MRRVVISGATGMIGSALLRHALSENIEALCLTHQKEISAALPREKRVRYLSAGLASYNTLAAGDAPYDVFFHLAWQSSSGQGRDDALLQTENIRYTLEAVKLARRLGCTVFIGAGSQAEYGPADGPLTPDTPARPQSGYGIAKYAAGCLSKLLCEQLGMRQCWARILSVFGPGDNPSSLISYTISELQKGGSPEFTKCEQTWDYLYADDAAAALFALAKYGRHGAAYPLGSGMPRKLSAFLLAIRDIINPACDLQFGKKDYPPHQSMFLCADTSALASDTGWQCKIAFEEGIRRILTPAAAETF